MKRLILTLIVFVLMITGCSKTEKHVVEQSATPPSATENTTAAITTTDAAQTTEDIIQIDTPSPQGFISEYHPIIIRPLDFECGILCGGFKQKWLSEDEAAAFVQGKEEYKLLNLTDSLGIGIGDTVRTDNTPIPYTIDIQSSLPENAGFIAISCDWNPLPRIPVQQSNSSEEYNNIVLKILEKNGLNDVPVNIVQNYKIDIEGDGQDEVLLCAQSIKPLGTTFAKNTYSLIVLRKIVDEKVEDIFLTKAIFLKDGEFGDGCVDNIEAFADLDGDGEMEIIIRYDYYEGFGYEIYDLVESQPDLVLQSTIGGK